MAYSAVFGVPPSDAECELVGRRLERSAPDADPLDDLLRSAPDRVRTWLVSKARLADGADAGYPLVSPGTLTDVLQARERLQPGLTVKPGRQRIGAWKLVRIGLLRVGCGLTFQEIGARAGCAPSSARKALVTHLRLLVEDRAYADQAAAALAEALRRDHGQGPERGVVRV
jgi:hypothetical protein